MASKNPQDMLSEVLAAPGAIRATAMKLPKRALVHMLSIAVADQVHDNDSWHKPDPWLVGILRDGFKGYENMTVRELADVASDTFRNGHDLIAAYRGFLQAVERGEKRRSNLRTMVEGRR